MSGTENGGITPFVIEAELKPSKSRWKQIITMMVLLVIASVVIYVLFFTAWGAKFREDPRKLRGEFHDKVQRHPVAAPLVFLAMYIAAAVCLLPVWWLQMLAGFGFGLWRGCFWSVLGATLAACCSFLVSRNLMADFFHRKVESRMDKLKEIDEKMGHNGLLVVMAIRLMHFVPFAISNYLFGLTRMNLAEVAVGTCLGGIPAIAFYVAGGAGIHPWRNARFIICVSVINLLLAIPIVLRYWKPHWFKKIGVE